MAWPRAGSRAWPRAESAEAASEVASLMALLLGAERLDDARRAAVDESYRDELMREFGISQAE